MWKKEGLGYGGLKGEGETSATSDTFTIIYLKRPPTGSRKLVQKKKNLKMVCFAGSTLGLTSPKKVNFASFGYSLVFAVDRGCLELFLL